MLGIDYANSLLALSASVLRHFGAETKHKTLPEADRLLAGGFRNVVLLVFDGLGMTALEHHLPPDSFLRRHLCQSLSSVFPPTTTAATTTLETGLSPAQHGWLGWSLHFPEVGGNVNLYPNTLSGTGGAPAADFHVARRFLPYTPLWEQIPKADPAVSAACVSPFGTHKIDSLPAQCETVSALCNSPGRHYVYGYWPQPDYDMHDHGVFSAQAAGHIRAIDEQVAAMCEGSSDALVFITADHGLVDVSWRFLSAYPEITACLARPPSVETRTLAFSVLPGRKKAFEAAFSKHFAYEFTLIPSGIALASGLFGPGTPHERVKDFLGDYIAVATREVALDSGRNTGEAMFAAAHAGGTVAEIWVPLCALSTRSAKAPRP